MMNQTDNSPALPSVVIKAFSEAAITAIHELTQLEAVVVTPAGDQPVVMPGQLVTAEIVLRRDFPGKMMLIVSGDIANLLAAHYLPAGTPLADGIVDDALGEFANVIAGQTKTMLKGTDYHFSLSLPVVMRTASVANECVPCSGTITISLGDAEQRLWLWIVLP